MSRWVQIVDVTRHLYVLWWMIYILFFYFGSLFIVVKRFLQTNREFRKVKIMLPFSEINGQSKGIYTA